MLLNLIPVAWRPHAKAILALAGVILVALPQVIPALPAAWQAGLSAFALAATPVVVWLTRNFTNEDPAGDDHSDNASVDHPDVEVV